MAIGNRHCQSVLLFIVCKTELEGYSYFLVFNSLKVPG
jgi:hypothetical protein